MTQFLLLAGLLDEQPQSIIFGLIVAAVGLWPLLGAALNLKFFMDTLPVPLWTAIMGRPATRVFFIVLGLLLIGLGLAIAVGLLAD